MTKPRKILLILLGLLILAIVTISSFLIMMSDINVTQKIACQSNLQKLARGLKKQLSSNAPYLKAQWCDTLEDKYGIASEEYFQCPGVNVGKCGYAINENIIGLDKLPSDVVVLFDSKSGWNQVGGKELLAPENHRGKGCNILFGNMEVKFVLSEEFYKLRWELGELKKP